VKIGLLKRNLITVYSLVVILTCLLVGCLRQPGEVISQSDKNSKDALLSSKTSSSFNYFDSKKKYSSTQAVVNGKVDEFTPVIKQVGHQEEKPGRVKISGDSVSKFENAVENSQKNPGKTLRKRPESWRSKSLIESAKRYQSKVAKSYHQKSDRIKVASSSMVQEISNGIQQIAKTVSSPPKQSQIESKNSNTKSSVADQFRTQELSRYYDQADRQDAHSQISQLGKDLKRDLEQAKPTLVDVDHDNRRLQINTIMERARQELVRKNYEYALFLAEQAMESSYRGHVAFGPEEESPQKLMQHIKSIASGRRDTEVKPIEHTKSKVQSNGGQSVQNFHFSPSTVHPLKKRPVAKPTKRSPLPGNASAPNQELPIITPRDLGIQRQRNSILPGHSRTQEPHAPSHGISLEPPAFDQQPEEQMEFPVPDKTQPQKSNPALHPDLKPNPNTFTDETPARIRISGPEPVQQESEKEVKKSTSPGPKLMLPKLPSVPQDLTSQAGQNQTHQNLMLNQSGKHQKTQTAPVKFRSKKQEDVKNEQSTLVDQKIAREQENGRAIKSTLTLDEIEWDLEEKRQPQPKSSWWGMSTVLLMVGGVIILLLLTIIVVLLRRSNSPS